MNWLMFPPTATHHFCLPCNEARNPIHPRHEGESPPKRDSGVSVSVGGEHRPLAGAGLFACLNAIESRAGARA